MNSVDFSIAAPGDTITEAYTAKLGMNNGSISVYNEIDHYNFSGSKYREYNFTLFVPAGDILSLYIYSANNSVIASNFSSIVSKTLVLSGQENYIIKIISSEFIVPPANYSLIISQFIGQEKQTVGSAKEVTIGSYNGYFELYNDGDWYNFSGQADKSYNFTISREKSSYIGLILFDYNLNLVDINWSLGPSNEIIKNGFDKYIIFVSSSELINLPQNYTLNISEVISNNSTSSTTENTSTIISSTTSSSQTETSKYSSQTIRTEESEVQNITFSALNFSWILFFPSLLVITSILKRKKAI